MAQHDWDEFWRSNKQLPGRPQRNLITLLTLIPEKGNKVLVDVGCGRAEGTNRFAAKTNARLILVDESQEALKQAAKTARGLNVDAQIIRGNAMRLDIPMETVDAFYSEGMIEHHRERDRLKILGQIYKKLKPGGRLVITVPNPESIPSRTNKAFQQITGLWSYGRMAELTRRKLEQELQTAGFAIVKRGGTNAYSSHVLGLFYYLKPVRNRVRRTLLSRDLNVRSGPNKYFGMETTVLAVKHR